MDRAQHITNNAVLGAPQGAPINECGALPVTRVEFADGVQACVSFWRPSAADLALLSSGRMVRLCVIGSTHAPVSVGVDGDGEML